MNSSGVTVKVDEAPDSFRIAPSGENPSQISGSALAITEATPLSMAAPSSTDVKKKRGRPRKYRGDGPVTMALSPMPISASIPLTGEFPAWKQSSSRGRSTDSFKKKHKLDFESQGQAGDRVSYSVGANFTPHVLTVNAGEDVTMKIMSFSQQGSKAICILAANGATSNVTLRQPNSSGGTLTYEGRFEILSLTGSFMPSDNGPTKSRSGGMSVSLAGPDGRVLGGGLAGMLVAAGPVQVVIGSFIPGHYQEQQKPKKQKFERAATFAGLPSHSSLSDERTADGVYTTHRPNLTSSASFRGENMISANAIHAKISAPEMIISAPVAAAAERKDQNSSKCEVSC